MKNQVIEVLNEEHGKRVIEYWKSKGIDTSMHQVTSTKEMGCVFIYYGVINGRFSNYKMCYVKENNAEIIELPEEENEFPRKMLVSNIEDGTYIERIVLCKLPGKTLKPYIAIAYDKEKEYEEGKVYYTTTWKYAKEISENVAEEMTLEQICKELGREIKIVK